MSLSIASIGETDHGGAGLSSLKLHDQFCRQGLNAKFYVNRKTSNRDSVLQMPTRPGRSREISFSVGLFPQTGGNPLYRNVPFTSGLSVTSEEALDEIHGWADVILLRWASVAISDYTVGRWARLNKPVVWCLSDMAPMTGGCHYSMGCEGFRSGCYPCPALAHSDRATKEIAERRARLWKGITFVSPSRWLESSMQKSLIGEGNNVKYIRTGVELDVFKPTDKSTARYKFGLKPDRKVILCGSASAREYRKGFSYLPEIVDRLNRSEIGDYQLMVFGSNSSDLESLNCDVISMGNIKDRNKLASIYSAADLVLLPYIEDNLPNVCLEAIACGVPVTSFAIGGMPDVIIPGVNGELATPFNIEELTTKVIKSLSADYSPGELRSWAVSNIDIREQARQYVDLFSELLDKTR